MSAPDVYIYESTLDSDDIVKPFVSKEMRVVFDSNNGVYNNQLLFSTASLTDTGKWVDYQNSYIEIPFQMAMKCSADISGAGKANSFMMGLKNGSIQLVDSIILQYNGTSMVQQSIFTNVIQHFKIMNQWTQEDLYKWGDATMFWPDTTNSFRFSDNTAGPFGDGTINNVISPYYSSTATNAQWLNPYQGFNTGFLRRLNNVATNTSSTATKNGFVNLPLTAAQAAYVGKNYYSVNNTGSAAAVFVWNTLLTLRLKELSDFFNKIPILKAGRIDLTINFNSFANTITYGTGTAAPADGSLLTLTATQLSGHTCPYMVSGAAVIGTSTNIPTQPLGVLTSGTLTTGCGINGINGVSALSGLTSPIFNNCRWYVPLYEPNPEFEKNLLATQPLKTIYYDDFYTYTSITNVSGNFQSLITSGVRNPKYLILVPFFNNNVLYSGNALSISPYQSCFDSAPATASPVSLTNFQVQCGGKTLFPIIEQFNFQQYMDEMSSIFGLNGGKSTDFASGLMTQQIWENAPIYVCNLSRRLPQDDLSDKSIQVSATINSTNPTATGGSAHVDFIAFVVYQRSVTFNLLNGLITSNV